MAADIRRALSPNVVFGAGLVVVGVLLTLQSAHIITFDALRQYWPLGIVAVGVAFVLQAFLPARTGEMAQPKFHWGPLILVLIVGTFWTQAAGRTGRTSTETKTGSFDQVRVTAVMGGSQLVSRSPAFKGGEVTSFMGGSQLDLREATIAPGEEAAIDVSALMGGIVIRVPENWLVDVGTTMIMGGVEDQRPKALRRKPADAATSTEAAEKSDKPDTSRAPILKIKGTIVMGGLVIKL